MFQYRTRINVGDCLESSLPLALEEEKRSSPLSLLPLH